MSKFKLLIIAISLIALVCLSAAEKPTYQPEFSVELSQNRLESAFLYRRVQTSPIDSSLKFKEKEKSGKFSSG